MEVVQIFHRSSYRIVRWNSSWTSLPRFRRKLPQSRSTWQSRCVLLAVERPGFPERVVEQIIDVPPRLFFRPVSCGFYDYVKGTASPPDLLSYPSSSPLQASVTWVVGGAGSCELLDDVAYQLDPELKDWAYLLQTSACDAEFCANLHPLHQRHQVWEGNLLPIDLASSEGLDCMKVNNDRLGQLREIRRHESRHIRPQVVRFVLPSVQRALVLA